ncbi:MAG: NAD-dependent epimerase/dehydratase family protein [Deltaproteobacteria bacterium]|nr:NAD-dependent epimerase/dehydratase family protein [Deltaproteobacteria bacterium]
MGNRLLRRLDAESSVERIIGIDIRPPEIRSAKLTFYSCDIRSPEVCEIIDREKVDTIAHLAFVLSSTRNKQQQYDIDVNGSRNVIEAVRRSRVTRVVLASSTSVYGVHADNPNPIGEDSPRRPNPDNAYAVHKVEVEDLFFRLAGEKKEVTVTVFRPCMILGPHMDNLISRCAWQAPQIAGVIGYNPQLQFVHEDDVVNAFSAAILQEMPGTYNLAGSGTITFDRFCVLFRKRCIRLPFRLLYMLFSLGWVLRLPVVMFSPGWLYFLKDVLIVGTDRIQQEYGFSPQYSTEAALESYLAARRAA